MSDVNQNTSGSAAPRSHWSLERGIVDRDEAAQACSALLDIVRPVAVLVDIDAITDYPDLLSDGVRNAQERLREIGRERRKRDPEMAVELDPQRDDHWELIQGYAPWSINVDVWPSRYRGRDPVATLHDCGYWITGHLTDEEALAFARRVAAIGPVVRIEPKRLFAGVRRVITGRKSSPRSRQ